MSGNLVVNDTNTITIWVMPQNTMKTSRQSVHPVTIGANKTDARGVTIMEKTKIKLGL